MKQFRRERDEFRSKQSARSEKRSKERRMARRGERAARLSIIESDSF